MDERLISTEMKDKLIVLFALDKIEIPLCEENIMDIISTKGDWIPYISCQHALYQLVDSGLVHKSCGAKVVYSITPEGRTCLSSFYPKIPLSTREEIIAYVSKQQPVYKRKQELFSDYFKNSDGTYTVVMRISEIGSNTPIMELNINVDSRASAKYAFNTWEEKAAKIYEFLYENLFD